jgi:SAM-dependent methyltransferase
VEPLSSLQRTHNARTIATRSIRSPGRSPWHRINETAVDVVEFPEGGPVWACTRCGGQLSRSRTRYSCDVCGQLWPVIDGIPHFVSEASYWGEIAESKLSWALEEMKTRHWKEVLGTSDDPEVARAFTFNANLNRVNWQYLLPSGRGRSALCVGEGMGTTAHALAANYAAVVAMEPVLPRVEFMRRRFIQDEIKNVRVIRAAFPDVPFAPGSFDLVVFNGVVEWLPSGQPSKPPAEVQLAGLRKAFGLLKPGGHVYVGIENRWSYEYFLGASDPHVLVPWVTILPRPMANWLMMRSTGRRYDAYLYGSRGYLRLLHEAGFATAQVLIAKGSYNDPESIVPTTGVASQYFFRAMDPKPQGSLRRLIQAAAMKLGLLAQIQYAFVMLGVKE